MCSGWTTPITNSWCFLCLPWVQRHTFEGALQDYLLADNSSKNMALNTVLIKLSLLNYLPVMPKVLSVLLENFVLVILQFKVSKARHYTGNTPPPIKMNNNNRGILQWELSNMSWHSMMKTSLHGKLDAAMNCKDILLGAMVWSLNVNHVPHFVRCNTIYISHHSYCSWFFARKILC